MLNFYVVVVTTQKNLPTAQGAVAHLKVMLA